MITTDEKGDTIENGQNNGHRTGGHKGRTYIAAGDSILMNFSGFLPGQVFFDQSSQWIWE